MHLRRFFWLVLAVATAVLTFGAAAASSGSTAKPSLGPHAEALANDQHTHHQLRVDRRPPNVTVVRLEVRPNLSQVDEAVDLIAGPGFVAAGGDIAVRGESVVGLPGGGVVALGRGGMATSGTTRRRWFRGGVLQHHLLDPRTGSPARSRWLEVTVAGPSCLHADVAAKAAFLHSDDGPDWLDERGLPGRFHGPDETVVNSAWRDAMEPVAA